MFAGVRTSSSCTSSRQQVLNPNLRSAGHACCNRPCPSSNSGLRSARRACPPARATNHYELLGLEQGASEEEVKAAFRRRAKELHPDVNTEEGADATFMAVKQAYEVLSDPKRRADYDATLTVRRIGFFRDVVEEEEEEDNNPWTQHRRMWEQEEGGSSGQQVAGSSGGAEDPAEMLERLARVMGAFPGGGLTAFQSGRLDPWGTSSSDAWFRRVEQQSENPQFYRGRGAPGGQGGDGFNPEWSPYRREDDTLQERTGWRPPGRGSEWSHPRRQWDEEGGGEDGPARRGRGPGRRGGSEGGLGGEFGGQPLR